MPLRTSTPKDIERTAVSLLYATTRVNAVNDELHDVSGLVHVTVHLSLLGLNMNGLGHIMLPQVKGSGRSSREK